MNNLRDLPNTEGFRFVGIAHDGRQLDCHVEKDATGCHVIRGEARFHDLKGWQYRQVIERKAQGGQ